MKSEIHPLLFLLVAACGQPEQPEVVAVDDTPAPLAEAEPIAVLSDKDLVRVCKGGAAFRNGTPLGSIKANKTDESMVRVSYTRDDGKRFAYDCTAQGNQVRFRMIDEAGPGTGPGVWSGAGSRTTFELFSDEIEFTDDFFDGSKDVRRIKI